MRWTGRSRATTEVTTWGSSRSPRSTPPSTSATPACATRRAATSSSRASPTTRRAPRARSCSTAPRRAPTASSSTGAIHGGLAEFAYRNELDLRDVAILGGERVGEPASLVPAERGPLIPFGGGIDSIVTVASGVDERRRPVRRRPARRALRGHRAPRRGHGARRGPLHPRARRPGARAARRLVRRPCPRDGHGLGPRDLRGDQPGSTCGDHEQRALRVGAQPRRRPAVRSTTSGPSPSRQRSCCAAGSPPPSTRPIEYYSALRDRSELWVAREFASHPEYLDAFMSCNRAFRQDPDDACDDVVRAVRQVPLHRPRPRALRRPRAPRVAVRRQ